MTMKDLSNLLTQSHIATALLAIAFLLLIIVFKLDSRKKNK